MRETGFVRYFLFLGAERGDLGWHIAPARVYTGLVRPAGLGAAKLVQGQDQGEGGRV